MTLLQKQQQSDRKKANIMLLVLFVMFVSSLLGLLVTQYVGNMIKISGLFKEYYSTYYYAYAGLELGLAKINYRERYSQKPFGYEDADTFSSFTQCQGACEFTMTISSRSQVITDSYNSAITSCTGSNDLFGSGSQVGRRSEAYAIEPGDGFIVPLFYDTSTGFSLVSYDTIEYGNDIDPDSQEFIRLGPQLYNDYGVGGSYSEEYIVRIIDDETENYLSSIEPTIGTPSPLDLASEGDLAYSGDIDNKNYLIVANATGVVKDFCLQLNPVSGSDHTELPTKYITVSSVAQIDDASVAFGAIKNNDLPSFIIYGTISTD